MSRAEGIPISHTHHRQRGVVLIFVLVVLLILGIGAAALMRAFDVSIVTATNLGFKRDIGNEGHLAIAQARAWFADNNALGNATNQRSDNAVYHYYATVQDSDSHGIPTQLLQSNPAALLYSDPAQLGGIKIYYLIDRLCFAGTTTTTSNACSLASYGDDKGGSSGIRKAGASSTQIFRVSVRVDGPRNTHAFLQETVSAPY